MKDSEITCDEIIESYDKERKTVPTNFIENKVACKTQNFYILLAFLLITINQNIEQNKKNLLLFYITNKEF